MSGIPGMGQLWQAALKIRVIMIPLPENTAAGVASGVCCDMKGCCRVSGGYAGRSLHSPSHTGREKIKIHGRALCPVVACGDYFFVEEQGNTGERVHIRQDKIHWGIGHTLCQI